MIDNCNLLHLVISRVKPKSIVKLRINIAAFLTTVLLLYLMMMVMTSQHNEWRRSFIRRIFAGGESGLQRTTGSAGKGSKINTT